MSYFFCPSLKCKKKKEKDKKKCPDNFFSPYLFLISQTSCEDEEKNVYTLNVVINQILRHFSYHIAYLNSIKSGAFKFYAHFHLF